MREGKFDFDFGGTWTVLKYDENGGFYKTKITKHVRPTKAVDFLCIPQGNQPPS